MPIVPDCPVTLPTTHEGWCLPNDLLKNVLHNVAYLFYLIQVSQHLLTLPVPRLGSPTALV